jgi:uncharacterized protein YndB with AHSA1/START domain
MSAATMAPMNHYALMTDWRLEAPVERVWEALYEVARWPQWWPYVLAVAELAPGDASGVGAVRRYTWSSRLPYRLSFEMRSTIVQRPYILEGEAVGELTGRGRWTLREEGIGTAVRYDWNVSTSRAWMNALAPLLAPAFRWNHGQVMAAGARGLAGHLGVKLLQG